MTISRNSWHARVFLWWYQQKHPYEFEGRSVNLCPYVRAVLLWGPLRRLFRTKLGYVAWPLYAAATEAVLYHFFGKYLLFVEVVFLAALLATAVFIAIVAGFMFLYGLIKESEGMVSFREILGMHIGAWHSRVCPVMLFESKEEDVK